MLSYRAVLAREARAGSARRACSSFTEIVVRRGTKSSPMIIVCIMGLASTSCAWISAAANRSANSAGLSLNCSGWSSLSAPSAAMLLPALPVLASLLQLSLPVLLLRLPLLAPPPPLKLALRLADLLLLPVLLALMPVPVLEASRASRCTCVSRIIDASSHDMHAGVARNTPLMGTGQVATSVSLRGGTPAARAAAAAAAEGLGPGAGTGAAVVPVVFACCDELAGPVLAAEVAEGDVVDSTAAPLLVAVPASPVATGRLLSLLVRGGGRGLGMASDRSLALALTALLEAGTGAGASVAPLLPLAASSPAASGEHALLPPPPTSPPTTAFAVALSPLPLAPAPAPAPAPAELTGLGIVPAAIPAASTAAAAALSFLFS